MRPLTFITSTLALALPLASGTASAAMVLGPAVQPHSPGHVSIIWQSTINTPQQVTLTSPGHPDVTVNSTMTSGTHNASFDDLVPGAGRGARGNAARLRSPSRR